MLEEEGRKGEAWVVVFDQIDLCLRIDYADLMLSSGEMSIDALARAMY